MTSVVTISQSHSQTNIDFSEADKTDDFENDQEGLMFELDSARSEGDSEDHAERAARERDTSLAKLHGGRFGDESETVRVHRRSKSTSQLGAAEAIIRRNPKNGPEAVVVLKEEKVCNAGTQ